MAGKTPEENKDPLQHIPRGIEVLVKKASIDPKFRELLLKERSAAAETIDLNLDPVETMMLNSVPAEQLETIISRTTVKPQTRRAFLGQAASVMLAALGASTLISCNGTWPPVTDGILPGPVAHFSYSPSDPAVDETVQFTDESYDDTGTIVQWVWDFGDEATPQSSTVQNPTCSFNSSGDHDVTLLVTNDASRASQRTKTVTVA